MKTITATLCALLLASPLMAGGKWLTVYYGCQVVERASSTAYPYQGEPPWELPWNDGVTHIIHFFNAPNVKLSAVANGYWTLWSGNDSTDYWWGSISSGQGGTGYGDSLIVIAHRHGVKVLTCVAGLGGNELITIAIDSTKLQTLCTSIANFVNRHNYDGVDVDWEIRWYQLTCGMSSGNTTITSAGLFGATIVPGMTVSASGGGIPSGATVVNVTNTSALTISQAPTQTNASATLFFGVANSHNLRFNRMLSNTLLAVCGPGKIITCAPGPFDGNSFYGPANDAYISQYNPQWYGSGGTFWNQNVGGNVIYLQSVLWKGYTPDQTNAFSIYENRTADNNGGLKAWVTAGHAKSKLGMGVNNYGWMWTATDTLFALASSGQVYFDQKYIDRKRVLANGGTDTWDTTRKASYIHGTASGNLSYPPTMTAGHKFLFDYKSVASVQADAQFIVDSGFGGMMIYEYWSDNDPTLSDTYRNPIIHAAGAILGGTNPPQYTITASAGAGGSITPTPTAVVDSATSQGFTITASGGYHIVSVVVDGLDQGAIGTYTFYNVTANHSISATFAQNAAAAMRRLRTKHY